mmetsp:Transcript_4562/g.7900  ORF Transcript_4562/g.7900 Transcript_4562/m.7900 type:complete len:204 (-) Transcript_4562:233-844(-)
MKLAVLTGLLGSAAAFAPASQKVASTALSAEKSPALPFLPYPENLKGYVGDDVGFDPLRISDYFPMDYLREAEIKHCRIAMLAFVGFIVPDIGFKIPIFADVPDFSSATAHDTFVDQGSMGLIALAASTFEMVSYIGVSEMLQGSGRAPGDFGFDPLKFSAGKSEEDLKLMQYKELKNGRLAMFGIGGIVTQAVLTGHGFPYV